MKRWFPVLIAAFCLLSLLNGCETNSYREGIVSEGIDVPKSVLDSAVQYVEKQYRFYRKHTGIFKEVDGKIMEIGEPASFDRWKMESIKLIHHYSDVEGYDLDLYQMDYWLHTTTPDQVTLSGGMQMEDDWFMPSYPGCTYLIYDVTDGEEPSYLFTMVSNDTAPGQESFLEDLKEVLQSQENR